MLVADKYLRGSVPRPLTIAGVVIFGILKFLAYLIASGTISGVTAVIIIQLTAAPLRPVKLREAFAVVRRRWRPFVKTIIYVTLRIILWSCLAIVPGIIVWIRYSLYAPVVLIEGLEKKAAMRRARELASRSWKTIIVVSILQFVIPMIVSAVVGRIKIGVDPERNSLSGQIYQQAFDLLNIFIVPLISIVPALLYVKMRQLGGESLSAAWAAVEEEQGKESAWQQRMRTRLSLHTPVSQKTTNS
jgi:hypothetical protein